MISAGKFPEAIDALKNTTLLDPTDFEAWSDLGLMCANNNQIEEAEDAYQHALTLNDHEAQVWMFYAGLLERENRLEKALVAYQHAFEYKPTEINLQINIGALYCKLDRYADAEACLFVGIRT